MRTLLAALRFPLVMLSSQPSEVQLEGGDHLPKLVMELPGDPFTFQFLGHFQLSAQFPELFQDC